jgi:hypothetical protein
LVGVAEGGFILGYEVSRRGYGVVVGLVVGLVLGQQLRGADIHPTFE